MLPPVSRIRDTIKNKAPIVDVDGVYLYCKLHSAGIDLSLMPLPTIPINGWESVSYTNVVEMSTKVPQVTSGV